jgi:hypothetical protein
MASNARKAFDESCDDIDRLLEIHRDLGGDSPGRRRRLEVLNKSAIVLITALWEAYCEDLAAEGIAHLVEHATTPDEIPKELLRRVAKELEQDDHELAIWRLAGSGWSAVLSARLTDFQDRRNRHLNTPKTTQINELFLDALGIAKISSSWRWRSVSATQAATKLDRYVSLRGEIAHRGAATSSITKYQVTDYYQHVKHLVAKTGGSVNWVVKKVTGKGIL